MDAATSLVATDVCTVLSGEKRIRRRTKPRRRCLAGSPGERGAEKKKEEKADSNLYQPLVETPAGGKISSAFEKRGSGEVY